MVASCEIHPTQIGEWQGHSNRWSSTKLPVECFVAGHDDLGGKPFTRARLRGPAQSAPACPMVDQGLERAGQCADVAGGNQQAALVVLDHLGDSANTRRNARAA